MSSARIWSTDSITTRAGVTDCADCADGAALPGDHTAIRATSVTDQQRIIDGSVPLGPPSSLRLDRRDGNAVAALAGTGGGERDPQRLDAVINGDRRLAAVQHVLARSSRAARVGVARTAP